MQAPFLVRVRSTGRFIWLKVFASKNLSFFIKWLQASITSTHLDFLMTRLSPGKHRCFLPLSLGNRLIDESGWWLAMSFYLITAMLNYFSKSSKFISKFLPSQYDNHSNLSEFRYKVFEKSKYFLNEIFVQWYLFR